MAYSKKDVDSIARKIVKQFGSRLQSLDPLYRKFIAGLIGVEAKKTATGFDESGKRFEPGVYQALKKVRDGLRPEYNRLTKKDLSDASDDALKNLATSWGATQIMGWHVIKNLPGASVDDLRNPEKHLKYAQDLARLVAAGYITGNNLAAAYRIWNTGSPTGKTHDPDYVENATDIANAAERLLSKQSDAQDAEKDTQVTSAPVVEIQAAQIVEPEPYNKIGFWATIRRDLVVATGGNITAAGILDFLRSAAGLPEWILPIMQIVAYGLLIATFGWFTFRAIHYAVDSWKQSQRVKQQIEALKAVKPPEC